MKWDLFFRFIKLKFHFKDQYNVNLNNKDQILNLEATKNVHLLTAVARLKEILKQQKLNLSNNEISVTIKDRTTYLKHCSVRTE